MWKNLIVDLEVGARVEELGVTNVAELSRRHAAAQPDVFALVEPGLHRRTMTWAELDDLVSGVAAGLAAEGLVAGQRLVLVGPNSIDFVVAYLAVLRAGLVAVPVDPEAEDDAVQEVAERSGARLVLDGLGRDFSTASRPLSAEGLAELAGAGHSPVVSPPDPEALAVLLSTAGTTDEDRPVMLSHRALLAHLVHVAALGVADRDSVVLALLPLCHVFGLNAVLGSWLLSGGRLVLQPGYPESLSEVITAESVTNLTLAPTHIYHLLQEDLLSEAMATVQTVLSGAAPLPWELARRFAERTGHRVDQGYGLTEAAPGVTTTLGGPLLGPGHVGRPLPGVELRIGNPSELAEAGEPGVISIRGDNLFSGYWPDGDDGPDEQGWFDTGDIGYLADGELFLIDRAAELITVDGFHVYPAEVEQAIGELAGVRAVAVVGQPDERFGERIVAFVVADAGVGVEQVTAHCEGRLPRFRRPAEVRIVDDLPRGITGKAKKGTLRRLLEHQR